MISVSSPPSGSAVPLWLWQLLPSGVQGWCTDRPAATEFLWSFSMTFSKTLMTVLYTVWVAWDVIVPTEQQTLAGYLDVLHKGWFGVAAPLLWGVWNGTTAKNKAAATAAKGNGT